MSSIPPTSLEPTAVALGVGRESSGTRSRRWRHSDRVFNGALTAAALIAPLMVFLFVAVLVYGAWPSIHEFGWKFLITSDWDPNPDHESFGALSFIVGTLVSSILAIALAAPVGIGVAAFLHEVLPGSLRGQVRFLIEILATIPSVVYGLWGYFVLVPWVRNYLEPALGNTLGHVPLIGVFFQGKMFGLGMLSAVLMLAIMIVPIIVSISMDSMRMVPASYRDAALALGATRWEMIRIGVLPAARSGLMGACVLALARALGETMAVTMVIGNDPAMHKSLFAASDTVSSVIANQFSEATSDLFTAALIELALILFCVTLVVNIVARLIVRRMGGQWSTPA